MCDDMSMSPADGRGFAVKRRDEESTVSSGGGEEGPRWEFEVTGIHMALVGHVVSYDTLVMCMHGHVICVHRHVICMYGHVICNHEHVICIPLTPLLEAL